MRRLRWCRPLALAGVLAVVSPIIPTSSAASAGEASGCSGTARSYGPNGGLLDTVTAPGGGGTEDDPFDIFRDGTVTYEGQTEQAMRNGRWSVELGGAIGVLTSLFEFATGKSLLSGTIGNDPVTSRSGQIETRRYTNRITGLQLVTVRLSGENGASCTATVWVRVHGDFWRSLIAIVGLVSVFLGALLLAVGAPRWAVENVLFEAIEPAIENRQNEAGR